MVYYIIIVVYLFVVYAVCGKYTLCYIRLFYITLQSISGMRKFHIAMIFAAEVLRGLSTWMYHQQCFAAGKRD